MSLGIHVANQLSTVQLWFTHIRFCVMNRVCSCQQSNHFTIQLPLLIYDIIQCYRSATGPADIYRYHKEHNNKITMVCAFQHTTIPYGVVELAPDGRISKLTEKPQMSYLTNTGVYLVEPEVVEAMEDGVAIGFPEVIEQWRARDNSYVGVYPVNESCWMDMGQLETLDDMRRRMENT